MFYMKSNNYINYRERKYFIAGTFSITR